MQNGSMAVLTENVARLMADRGDVQTGVAERGGLSQRAVGYVLTYGKTHHTSPTLRTIDGLAKAFDVPVWMLFVPNLPIELMRSRRVADLVQNYVAASDDGRSTIDRIAASEAKYTAINMGRDSKTG